MASAPEGMGEIILVVFVLFVAMALVVTFLEKAGIDFKSLFSSSTTTVQQEQAKASVDALACAMGAVTTNNDRRQCIADFQGGGKATIRCVKNGDVTSCDVNNFQLKQQVPQASEWIEGYGDPLMVVYARQFPAGADAAWRRTETYGGETVIDLLLVSSGIGNLFKFGKTIVVFSKKASSVTGGFKTFYTTIKNLLRDPAFVSEDLGYLKKFGLRVPSEAVKKTARFRRLARDVAFGFTLTEVDKALLKIDSIAAKYQAFEESLVLKLPYEDPFNKPIEGLGVMPVMLENTDDEFYLASPCAADIHLQKAVIACNQFSVDNSDKSVSCKSPDADLDASSIATIPANERCSQDIVENFQGEVDKTVPQQIKELDTTEELKIYNTQTLTFTDPVKKLSFAVRGDGEEVVITKLIAQVGGTSREFPVQRGPFGASYRFENGEVKITFAAAGCANTAASGLQCILDDFEVQPKPGCTYCDELKARVESINEINLRRRYTTTNQNVRVIVNYIGASYYKNDNRGFFSFLATPRYDVTYQDGDSNGQADAITIESRGAGETLFTGDVIGTPDLLLLDQNNDGKMDMLTRNDCKIPGVAATVNRRATDDHNFCFSENTVGSVLVSASAWAPEILSGAGAVIGGIVGGTAGGAGALPGVYAGQKIGNAIGAPIYALGWGYRKAFGSSSVWPGR